jgi:hypothetical protein
MKVLSETIDNGRVVELTHNEFTELMILARALEGKTNDELRFDFQMHDRSFVADDPIDFNGVFGAILAFSEAKFRLNELKQLVQSFEEYLKVNA